MKIWKVKATLTSIIEKKGEDSLSTHFKHIFLFKDEGKLSGFLTENYFKVWIHQQGWVEQQVLSTQVSGQFYILDQGTQIVFRAKLNAIARIMVLMITVLLGFGLLTGIIIQENNDIGFLIPRVIVSIIIMMLFLLVPALIYRHTQKTIIKYLTDRLNLNSSN